LCGLPGVVVRNRLADLPQEVVGATVSDEPELPLQVSDGIVEPAA
jgi:hypothetical protein